MADETPTKSSYGKRPLWQWILLYVIIGAVVYAGIYYFFIKNKSGGYSYTQTTPTQNSGY